MSFIGVFWTFECFFPCQLVVNGRDLTAGDVCATFLKGQGKLVFIWLKLPYLCHFAKPQGMFVQFPQIIIMKIHNEFNLYIRS